MSDLVRSILLVCLFVLAVWAIGSVVGFQISLVSTLVGSVVLTILATLLFGGFRRLRRG